MSSINSIGGNNPIHRVNPKQVYQPAPTQAGAAASRTDKVELGGVGHLLTQLKNNDIRVDKVAEIKAAIAAGTYETDEKLTAAADKLLDDVL